MGCLQGHVAVITGAGRGIGRAEALFFAREGAAVVVNDLGCDREGRGSDPAVADAVVAEILEQGGRAVASADDITDAETPARLVALARERFGRVDSIVSSAGVALDRAVLNLEPDELERVLSVHVRAAFALTRAAARAFVDQGGGGSIVLTTSPAAYFGTARSSGLAAAAAAVIGLTRSAAIELRRHGVRINAIAPTARTRGTDHLPTFQGVNAHSMGPEHVAPVAAFLVSDLSAEVNGEVLGVAGARVYAFRGRETTGAFAEGGPFTPEAIRDAWAEISAGR